MLPAIKNNIVSRLQQEILQMQGFREVPARRVDMGLGAVEAAFPNGVFPTGAVHEFLSNARESAAATSGFMAGLLGHIMNDDGLCIWISTRRNLYPPALALFGIAPERIIFIDVQKETEVLWVMEEALKCSALSAVVGELQEISFAQSRRLQLAVEQSHVTGLMHCYNPNKSNSTTCVARWRISPVNSRLEAGMPGVGHPRWHVELLKVRNGKPGAWDLQWCGSRFQQVQEGAAASEDHLLKAG